MAAKPMRRVLTVVATPNTLGVATTVSFLTEETARRRKYTPEQKDQFLSVVDRLGSVSAAAAELGFNQMTCYQWARKAGLTQGKPRNRQAGQRKYTREEKDEFFVVFDRLKSTRQAARELGLNPDTCAGWVRKAGLKSYGKPGAGPHPGRDEYFRLRKTGLNRRKAAAVVGIHLRSAEEWDRGIRKSGDRRIYPDGRVVDYKRGVTTMTPPAGTTGPALVPSIPVAALEKTIDPRFLSVQERETIRDLKAAGTATRAIAYALGRSPSTISRELDRNTDPRLGYLPHGAQRMAAARRARPKSAKLAGESDLRDYVKDKLLIRWSPEQISHTLVEEFPDNPEMRVSPETIYQALYVQARGGLKREIQTALRTGRTRRKPHRTGEQRTSRFVDPMVMISERPPEIEDRAVPGHWEGDLITGAYNQSAIATLVERTTRYVMLVHLPGDHTAETVRDGLVKTMATLPEHLRGSLTWDQGAEMATHKSFTIATDMPVYFCDPGSPWQRGSNENTNGLLRQYFPKGTDLSVYGPEDLEHVAQELNGRPRKTLGWNTPAERLRDLLLTT
jgi:IS30 family transposase/transposase-like protein